MDYSDDEVFGEDWRNDVPTRPPPAQLRAVLAGDSPAPSFAAAPTDVLLAVFRLLPTDDRMRCREVCGGWLDLLCDTALWSALDVAGGLSLSLP